MTEANRGDCRMALDFTSLLDRIKEGDESAREELFEVVYNELRNLAHRQMRAERSDHTLQTTALVHEAFLRLGQKRDIDWKDRGHYLRAAAGTMRAILVDHARQKKALKRSASGERVLLDEVLAYYEDQSLDVLDLDEVLNRLAERNSQLAQIFQLRMFAGLTADETAQALELSKRTVERHWDEAKTWVTSQLKKDV